MKPFPHKPDEAVLAERLAADKQKFEALPGDAPGRKAAYYDEASRLACSLAALSYAFEAPAAEVKEYAVQATRYATRAIACDESLDPITFQRYLALAIWTYDSNFRGRLATFGRGQFTNPDQPCDEAITRVAEAFAALAWKRPEMAAEHAGNGLKRIARGLVSTPIVNAVAPLLRITESMAKNDLPGLRAAVSERTTQFLRAASAEHARNNPDLLIDLVGLALVRLGNADYGLSVEPKSVFIPTGLF